MSTNWSLTSTYVGAPFLEKTLKKKYCSCLEERENKSLVAAKDRLTPAPRNTKPNGQWRANHAQRLFTCTGSPRTRASEKHTAWGLNKETESSLLMEDRRVKTGYFMPDIALSRWSPELSHWSLAVGREYALYKNESQTKTQKKWEQMQKKVVSQWSLWNISLKWSGKKQHLKHQVAYLTNRTTQKFLQISSCPRPPCAQCAPRWESFTRNHARFRGSSPTFSWHALAQEFHSNDFHGSQNPVMHCWRFLPEDSWSQRPDPIGWCFIISINVRNRISETLVYLGEVVVTNSSQPEMYCLWWEDSVTDQDRPKCPFLAPFHNLQGRFSLSRVENGRKNRFQTTVVNVYLSVLFNSDGSDQRQASLSRETCGLAIRSLALKWSCGASDKGRWRRKLESPWYLEFWGILLC